MEVSKGVYLDYVAGQVVLKADVAPVMNPILDKFKEDVESGKIDPVSGTDLDKVALLQAVEIIKKEINR